MFDLGFTEVTIVCIVALIIVGPEDYQNYLNNWHFFKKSSAFYH